MVDSAVSLPGLERSTHLSQSGNRILQASTGIIVDESLQLVGDRFRISFRATQSFLVAGLQNPPKDFSRVLPTLLHSGEYSCQFNLSEMPEGDDFFVSLRDATGKEHRWGKLTANRQQLASASIRRSAADNRRVAIGQTSFRKNDVDLQALLYVDLFDLTVALRISANNDNEDFLADSLHAENSSDSAPIRFSVVSAVYNVEKYLDEFFESMVNQSLDFEFHIELILVDDGSTDGSAKIIKKWQRKHPHNIRYFHKSNGGPASARNVGLDKASHPWVTFTDPDDFVVPKYFGEVARAIARHGSSTALVSCNLIFYFEKSRTMADKHPLRFRFASGERAMAANELGRFVHLSAPSGFFRLDLIRQHSLRFDERVKPFFEDAQFTGRYLLRARNELVVFLPEAKYVYRRRADQSSLLQSETHHPGVYSDQISFGYTGLLRDAAALGAGVSAQHAQFIVLYSLSWHFERIVDHPEALAALTDDQKRKFLDLLAETFSYIDASAIMDYEVYGLPFAHRVGIFNLFKNADPPLQQVEVNGYDGAKGMVKILYWSGHRGPTASFLVNGADVAAAYHKSRRVDFAGEAFCWEHISWVPLSATQSLAVRFDDHDAEIRARSKSLGYRAAASELRLALIQPPPAPVVLPALVRDLRRAARRPEGVAAFKDAWLFMDRDNAADDSAERLYRYVRRHSPHINAFFVLKRGAPDWQRLAADDFRLLGFNEPEHAIGLLNAAYLISSQADHYVLNYLGDPFADMLSYKFVFLQHGVIKDDISKWLNQIPFDCLITSTQREYDSVVADGSPYCFTEKEVALTGLPRHDALLDGPRTDDRTIVIMPTWRAALSGPAHGPGNARSPIEAFYRSDFARRWKAVLHSQRLRSIAENAGCRLVFVPHPNLEQYLDFLRPPSDVEIRRFGNGTPIANTFRSLSLFVTDFSSKAFDVAYLEKPVIYYQFDREEFFGGGHASQPGYFDYVNDGFGPVCELEGALLDTIEALLPAGDIADTVYRERADRTFSFRDGKCSERVFRAILDMDRELGQESRVDEIASVRSVG